MGNCCKCKRKSAKKIVLLLVGLDNAGKTVAVKGLAGENADGSIPTVGFSVVNLNYLDYNVQIYDLGGGPDIRGIWHRYFVDAHGIIFVLDASDCDRFNEVKSVLENLLSHRKISGKPLLVLANKQDNKEALDEIDVVENLGLEDLVNEKKCPTLVESCSAKEIHQSNNKIDPGIENGYRWLLNYILKDYANLNQRRKD
ncbi:ADP ribosylation factor-like 2 [Carabus blaptoides fortunei]